MNRLLAFALVLALAGLAAHAVAVWRPSVLIHAVVVVKGGPS